jgi:hypothetical protein
MPTQPEEKPEGKETPPSFDYTQPKPEDFASILFGVAFVENAMEKALSDLLKDSAKVVKIWWDEYDGSIELGFSHGTPKDFTATEELRSLLLSWGFGMAYLNFTDGTQQHISWNRASSERKVYSDNSWRWNEEKANKCETP